MADPTTTNVLLSIPTRGSNVGVWDTPVNGDFTALDGMLGGAATISLAAATTLTLSVPATGAVTPAAGPNQSQNALIKFTGTLAGNAVVKLTLPRLYIFDNQCTVATSYIQIAPASGTGTVIGLPPGEKTQVAFDGTNVDFVGLGRVGEALDLHGVTTLPPWMSACSKLPYLIKDGLTYSSSVYPALGAQLGSTFGGNGITTFGLPDERNRARIGLDTNGPGSFSNRLTSAGCGINGQALGAAGGDQNMPQHLHSTTDPGHLHAETNAVTGGGSSYSSGSGAQNFAPNTGTATTGITINNAGTGTGGNVPPSIVSFLPLIKT